MKSIILGLNTQEKLYEETLKLKQLISELQEQNLRLKTRNTNLEVTIDK